MLRRLLAVLRRPSTRWSVLTLLVTGIVGGLLLRSGLDATLAATSTPAFCTGCHEMRDAAFAEYRQTAHYANRSGVRATCADCHVPRDFTHKVVAKVRATNEVWGKLVGTIDTPEKYEAKRMVLATRVWDDMKASDSRECRACHAIEGMDPEKQRPIARAVHAKVPELGKTCIDCHKGIAHVRPKPPAATPAPAAG